jgi:hypothetical protein
LCYIPEKKKIQLGKPLQPPPSKRKKEKRKNHKYFMVEERPVFFFQLVHIPANLLNIKSHASTGALYVLVFRLQASAIVLAHVSRGKRKITIIERMNNSDNKNSTIHDNKVRS